MSFDASGLTVYVNGEFVDGSSASVSVFDHGLLYGDGIFEGMRVFAGALFRPNDHLDRLERGARAIGLTLSLRRTELLQVVAEVVLRSGLEDAHVRPVITRGFGAPGMEPWRCDHPSVMVTAYPYPPVLGDQPIRVMTSTVVRKAPRSIGAHIKSLNYLDSILAKQQARACGMQDAVMLDGFGAVAECTGANLFAVFGDELHTPTTRAALPGVTRRTIIELATGSGIPVVERDIWPTELYVTDAAFVTGSGAGVVPIGEIDGRPVGTVDHPVFVQLAEGYRAAVRDSRLTMSLAAAAA